jgi:hypothetical protein
MYAITMSYRMVVALVDIHENYIGEDSPRFDWRTSRALERRNLVTNKTKKVKGKETFSSLTKKGKASLEMCRFEFETAQEFINSLAA